MQLRLASAALSAVERVNAGMAFLDKTSKGWDSKIDLKGLDIEYDCGCVIGHVYGSYNDHRKRLFGSSEKAADLGFYAYAAGTPDAGAEYAALTTAWKTAIDTRRALRQLAFIHRMSVPTTRTRKRERERIAA